MDACQTGSTLFLNEGVPKSPKGEKMSEEWFCFWECLDIFETDLLENVRLIYYYAFYGACMESHEEKTKLAMIFMSRAAVPSNLVSVQRTHHNMNPSQDFLFPFSAFNHSAFSSFNIVAVVMLCYMLATLSLETLQELQHY